MFTACKSCFRRVEYFDADPHPDGLEMSEQALQYSNGDSYDVSFQCLIFNRLTLGHHFCRSCTAQGFIMHSLG